MSYDDIAPDAVLATQEENHLDRQIKCLDTVIALYDFPGTQPSHLRLDIGDTVYVLLKNESGWWDGVITNNSGRVCRGWFPKNYVRSVNYVQPVLNKLQSNKEIDSITAANTAANVLIPLFTNLLQKSLAPPKESSNATSRKNSVVSFALSELSTHSDKNLRRQERSEKLERMDRSDKGERIEKGEKTENLDKLDKFGSFSKPEKLEKDHYFTKKESEVTLHPISVHQASLASTVSMPLSGNSICNSHGSSSNSVPFASRQSSDGVKFTSLEDAELLVAEIKRTRGENIIWLPRVTDQGDISFYSEVLDIYCDSLPLAPMIPSIDCNGGRVTIPTISAIEDDSIVSRLFFPPFYRNETNENSSRSSLSITKAFESAKRDSEGSILSQTSTASYHHFDQPFFITPGLFYEHYSDISSWTDLKERFEFLLDLTWKALKDSNKQLFNMHFSQLTKVISMVMSAARLTQSDFIDTHLEKSIRRKLRRLSEAFAQMYINGLLHLRVMLHLHSHLAVDYFNLNIHSLNSSTATTPQQRADLYGSDSTFAIPKSRDSVDAPSGSRNPVGTGDVANSYMHQINEDIHIIESKMNSLIQIFLELSNNKMVYKREYDTSDASEDEGVDRSDVLPQVYPRFITNEFNGGNWCNPFFAGAHKILNLSGDQLKNKYHLKVIIDNAAYEKAKSHSDDLKKVASDVLEYFEPARQKRYYNETLLNERNEHILRVMYRYLHHATSFVDLLESLDFTVFCLIKRYPSIDSNGEIKTDSFGARNESIESNLTFDYPIVLDFFHSKHRFHYLLSRIITQSQSLTLEDPDSFTAMKEEEAVLYGKDQVKDTLETSARMLGNILMKQIQQQAEDRFAFNLDVIVSDLLRDMTDLSDSILDTIKLLVDERETILNYATRVMHDDFNMDLLLTESNNTAAENRTDDSGGQYFSGKTRSDSVAWYLQGDEEHDLLLDVKGNIKGGTKEALVAHLTHHKVFDAAFNTVFLTTFATMMPLVELIHLLINRFTAEAPEGLSYEEFLEWREQKQSKIRIKVLNVMKIILEKHWSESYKSRVALHLWLDFLKQPDAKSFPVTETIIGLIKRLLNNEELDITVKPQILGKPPAPLLKGFSLRKIKLVDIEYIELARQLTLRDFELFRKITKLACIHKIWGKKSGLSESTEHISNFIKASNQLTNFVAYMIVRKEDQRKRVQVIRYFVNVAEKCHQYNNYSSMTAIISALYSSPIHRLKKTWSFVSKETLLKLENMNKLMNSSRNFNEYRDMLKFVSAEPCIPFFGVYLTDLTFIDHGNEDHLLKRTRMINFAKRAKTTEIVMGMESFMKFGFNFITVPEIQQYLDSWLDKCPTIQEQYHISLVIEPKEETKHQQAGTLSLMAGKL